MLRVHIVSDRFLPPSLYAINPLIPGRPAMPGTGTITPHPSDTPGLVPDIESPMPRTETPGLPGSAPAPLPAPGPDAPDPGAPAPQNPPDIGGDMPDPGAPLPGGGVEVPAVDIPDYPAAIPVPA